MSDFPRLLDDLLVAACLLHDECGSTREEILCNVRELESEPLAAVLSHHSALAARVVELEAMERRYRAMFPLFVEARDALPAISEASRRLHGIAADLADRMDDVGVKERWEARAALAGSHD